MCRVLYDFKATTDDELDVRAGDCVLIESRLGDGWLIGQIVSNSLDGMSNSRIGRFPASYVASASTT